MVSRDYPHLSAWERRADRARRLAERYPATKEILLFYAGLAEWQGRIAPRATSLETLVDFLPLLADLVRSTGPAILSDAARELDPDGWRGHLEAVWQANGSASRRDFFARALLQPFAAGLASGCECPWCRKPPQVGCLTPRGEGLALEVVCALCLRARPFPRGRCPGCGEAGEGKLPNFSAPDFPHLGIQACESCRAYLPLVDVAREPQAIPEVDELAGLPLDLWAAENGYHKLQPNLAGI